MAGFTNTTQFQHAGEKACVSVEKYLTGKVVNLGGKQDPNVHRVLADTGESLRVAATELQLAAERENQVYRLVTLRVQGEQHLQTKALRNLHLIQFVPQAVEVDYFRHCRAKQIPMRISVVAAGEFEVGQPVSDLPLHNFRIQPYNLPHALRAAALFR